MKLLASKFNEKKFFLRSQLYARAYVRIWTLRHDDAVFTIGRKVKLIQSELVFEQVEVIRSPIIENPC